MPPSNVERAAPTNVGDGPRVDQLGGDQFRDTKTASACQEQMSPQQLRDAIEAAPPLTAIVYFVGECIGKDDRPVGRAAMQLYADGVVELLRRRVRPIPKRQQHGGEFQYFVVKRCEPRPPRKVWQWNDAGGEA